MHLNQEQWWPLQEEREQQPLSMPEQIFCLCKNAGGFFELLAHGSRKQTGGGQTGSGGSADYAGNWSEYGLDDQMY